MPYSHLHCRNFRFCVKFRWKFCVIFISYFYSLFSSSVCYREVSGSLLATLFIISVLLCQILFNLLTFIGSRTLENMSVFSKQLSPMPSVKTSSTLFWFSALSAIYLLPEATCAYFERFNETYYTFLQCCESSPMSVQITSWLQNGHMMFIGASNIYKDKERRPNSMGSNRYYLYATQGILYRDKRLKTFLALFSHTKHKQQC